MAYTATAKVMLASPGDVAQARRIGRDVIDEWNASKDCAEIGLTAPRTVEAAHAGLRKLAREMTH